MPRGILGPGKMTRRQLEQRVKQLEEQNGELKAQCMELEDSFYVSLLALSRMLRDADSRTVASMLRLLMGKAPKESDDEGSSGQ